MSACVRPRVWEALRILNGTVVSVSSPQHGRTAVTGTLRPRRRATRHWPSRTLPRARLTQAGDPRTTPPPCSAPALSHIPLTPSSPRLRENPPTRRTPGAEKRRRQRRWKRRVSACLPNSELRGGEVHTQQFPPGHELHTPPQQEGKTSQTPVTSTLTHSHTPRTRVTVSACQEDSSFTCPPSPTTKASHTVHASPRRQPAPRRRGNIPVIAPRSAVCIGSHPSVLTGKSLDLPS